MGIENQAERGQQRRRRVALRFTDAALESAFQLDLGQRLQRQQQLGLGIAVGLWVTAGLLLPVLYPIDSGPLWLAITVPIAIEVVALLFGGRLVSWDAQQLVQGLVNLAGGLAMIAITTVVAGIPGMLAPALLLNSIFAFSVVRIGFVIGLVAQLPTLLGIGTLAALSTYPEINWFNTFLVASGMGVAAFGAYMLESSSRARFLQRRQLRDQGEALSREMAKSDRLLRSMLPTAVAARLRDQPGVIADAVEEASVVFADLVGFTHIGAGMSPTELVSLLNELFGRFDELAARHGLEKIKTIGDGYLAVAGVPRPAADHADRAVRFGLALVAATRALGAERDVPLQVRVGVHSGPLVAGVIGRDKLAYDLWGDTVNVASRMESQGLPDRVQVSAATAQHLTAAVQLEPRGSIEVRGRGPMPVLLVSAEDQERHRLVD